MSFSEGYCKDYGEQFEYDEDPVIIGGTGGLNSNTSSSSLSTANVNPPSERPSAIRCASEMSIDISDLQDVLGEEDYANRLAPSSMYSSNALLDGHTSPLHHLMSVGDLSRRSDDDDSGEFMNYQINDRGVNSSTIQFDEIPEDCFQQNYKSVPSSFHKISSPFAIKEHRHEDQQQLLSTVDEQEESESSMSASTSSLVTSQELSSRNVFQSSNGSLNSRRKVKFEISTRLEDIQEFEKPDVEDYHMLYYTAHELQKMIDGHRAEERRERQVLR